MPPSASSTEGVDDDGSVPRRGECEVFEDLEGVILPEKTAAELADPFFSYKVEKELEQV